MKWSVGENVYVNMGSRSRKGTIKQIIHQGKFSLYGVQIKNKIIFVKSNQLSKLPLANS